MNKKLTEEDKQFIMKTAKDSFDMIINVDDIRKAFKILTDMDIAPMPRMRRELFNVHTNPKVLEPVEERKAPESIQKRIDEAKKLQEVPLTELQVEYNRQHDLMEAETKKLIEESKNAKPKKSVKKKTV